MKHSSYRVGTDFEFSIFFSLQEQLEGFVFTASIAWKIGIGSWSWQLQINIDLKRRLHSFAAQCVPRSNSHHKNQQFARCTAAGCENEERLDALRFQSKSKVIAEWREDTARQQWSPSIIATADAAIETSATAAAAVVGQHGNVADHVGLFAEIDVHVPEQQ